MGPMSRSVALATMLGLLGCPGPEWASQSARGGLYSPCGPDIPQQACPGGEPAQDGNASDGLLRLVTGTRGTHTLHAFSIGCSISFDTVGTTENDGDLCPDCVLTLQMSHASLDDGCGVGTWAYTSWVGLVPYETGEYRLYVSLDRADWYAVGTGAIEGWSLEYAAYSGDDPSYASGYYGEPYYGFIGDHELFNN